MRPTVLVVEDEMLIRWQMADDLARLGFVVVEADNAASALRILETNANIQVVFTDVQMPGTMDGIALAHHVRERWPPTIIVVCSGNAIPEQANLPSEIAILAKPMDTDILTALVSDIFDRLSALAGQTPAPGAPSLKSC